MSYWGHRAEDSDFAAGAVGASVFLIKKRMLQDIESDPDFSHPEQSILSTLVCLRLIGERFPKNLKVHFRKKDFEKAKSSFYSWYEKSASKIPEEYREKIFQEAESEFLLFESRIFQK